MLKEHSSEDNQHTIAATSSGCPIRPSGILDTIYSLCASVTWLSIFVSITAGVIQLTKIPVLANSLPSERVKAITPAFDAL